MITFMTIDIIKGVIAIIVFIAAIASVFIGEGSAQAFLIPLATFVFGYYFKQQIEVLITKQIVKARQQ